MLLCNCRSQGELLPSVAGSILFHDQTRESDLCPRCGLETKEIKPKYIKIPKSSFTAFRFLYASEKQISGLSKTILLGGLPDVWISLRSGARILDSVKQHRKPLRKIFVWNLSLSMRNTNSAGSWTSKIPEEEINDSGIKLLYQKILRPEVVQKHITSGLKHDLRILHSELRRQFEDDVFSDLSLTSQSSNSSIGTIIGETTLQTDDHVTFNSFSRDVSVDLNNGPMTTSELLSPLTGLSSLSPINPQLLPGAFENKDLQDLRFASSLVANVPLQSAPVKDQEKKVLEKISATQPNVLRKPLQRILQKQKMEKQKMEKVTFGKQRSQKPRVQFVYPIPEQEEILAMLRKEKIVTNKSIPKLFQRLKDRTYDGVGTKQPKNSFKGHLVDRIKLYAVGDIIRVDKMLVKVCFASKLFNLSDYLDYSTLQSVVEERWCEYFVVLRRGGNEKDLLQTQLFKVRRKNNFNSHPDYAFTILPKVQVGLFSSLDKSIGVIHPVEDGSRLFIMNTRYYGQAIKWMYLVKCYLDEPFLSHLLVHLSDSNFTFKINLPTDLIRRAIEPNESFEIVRNFYGYEYQRDLLFEYVVNRLSSSLRRSNLNHQMSNLPPLKFWLAYKFNDRAEWVANNSLSLLIRSQLFAESSPLELFPIPDDESNNGTILPTVEGFLGRVSNDTNKNTSWALGYKIQYFFLTQNLLFVASLQSAIPPSPQNDFLREDCDRRDKSESIPEIYENNFFELDSNGHIPWLGSPAFNRNDRLALEEFSRKVQLVVASKYVIDICSIDSIENLSPHLIPAKAYRSHLLAWISNTPVREEVPILDSSFEIKFSNGSKMQLLASTSNVRDKWVSHLTKAVAFWRKQSYDRISSNIRVRESNQYKAMTDDGKKLDATFDHFGAFDEVHATTLIGSLASSVLAMSTAVLFSGELYYKSKTRSYFVKKFVVLCPGYLTIYSCVKSPKMTSREAKLPCHERAFTISLSDSYIYTDASPQYNDTNFLEAKSPGHDKLPRLYPDGWKSTEESTKLRFTVWCGSKGAWKSLKPKPKPKPKNGRAQVQNNKDEASALLKFPQIRGKKFLFQARSRQEQELWVQSILEEMNRFSYE